MPKKNNKITDSQNPIDLEKDSIAEAEAMARHSSQASVDEVAGNPDEEAEKGLAAEEGADADAIVPAELAAIHTRNETAQALNSSVDAETEGKEKPASKKATSPAKAKKAKIRSKSYQSAKAHIEVGKLYPLDEAIELVKKVSISKFDGSVEVHFRLMKKKSKGSTESAKGVFHLPHGTGKEKKIVILDEAKIDEIAKTKKN